MIARLWRGLVRTEKLAEYVDIVERTGISGYRSTPGNAGAQLLTRDIGNGRSELITLSWWADLDQIRAFAGGDIEVAKYYPEDDEYLLEREHTVAHYTVAPPSQLPTAALGEGDDHTATGFSVSRVLSGGPASCSPTSSSQRSSPVGSLWRDSARRPHASAWTPGPAA